MVGGDILAYAQHAWAGSRKSRLLAGRALVVTMASASLLVACSKGSFTDYDPAGGATKKDYESLENRRPAEQKAAEEPPIPELQSVLAAPSAPELADTRRVSIAVTETTPLRDIFIELARKAQVDLELDQRISGGIIMTATDRPLIDVVDRICELAELRYRFEKNILHVEIDDPYLEQYHLDVLNLARSSTSNISSSTDASSTAQAIGAGGGGGGNNKSDSTVTSTSKGDFWASVTTNVRSILAGIKSRRPLQSAAINASYVPMPDAASQDTQQQSSQKAPAAGGKVAGMLAQAQGLQQRQSQLDATLAQDLPGVSTQSETIAVAAPTVDNKSGVASVTDAGDLSVNPDAGIVTVFANQRQHKAIARYLRDVLESVNKQVLIEAKIMEISLSDQYRTGINWSAVLGPSTAAGAVLPGGTRILTDFSRGVTTDASPNPTISVGVTNKRNTFSAAAQLINQFGTVRTLSNPRLTVVNNQTAVLRVAQNQVFFQITANTTDATPTSAARVTVTSQIKTVPVGIIMSVQPAVDPVTRRISLSLRPSITRITGYVQDPGVQLTMAQFSANNPGLVQSISSLIPIIESREMDSMVNMDSGETMVLGGLMQDSSTITREGLPGVMDVPILGQAVSSNTKQNLVTELVIFIRATLVNDRGTVADEDIRLYKTFTPDPRPVSF
jgi:MSHA biogenesis protein MshL